MPPNLAAWLAIIHTFPHPRRDLPRFMMSTDLPPTSRWIPIDKNNEACERMLKNDERYRFVIDIASLKQALEMQHG
jgi:hypothetical protein